MAQRISISDKFTFGKLLRFAVPSIVMVIFTSLYGIVDGLFVSNFAGDDAFTAVNLFLPVFYLLGAVGFLLGSGGCALTSVVAAIGVLFTAIFMPIMPRLATALGAEGAVHEVCAEYGFIMLGGMLPFMLQSYFQYF